MYGRSVKGESLILTVRRLKLRQSGGLDQSDKRALTDRQLIRCLFLKEGGEVVEREARQAKDLKKEKNLVVRGSGVNG